MESLELFKMQFDIYNSLKLYGANFAEFEDISGEMYLFWNYIDSKKLELAKKCLDKVVLKLGVNHSEVIQMETEWILCHEGGL